ncbi:putative MFS family arabinose efflux permease [Kribbella amoyensis]|uniref:Putative MFS family arabinose efflux permease n=1 Tax=Kribbella amoyensis TaxID=996641 RepID=A0A561BZM9_9ACTN|nr:putative MFS family arabinose efflux permease [Kribbella amoyensis]
MPIEVISRSDGVAKSAVQRRVLVVLAGAQILSGVGLAAGVTVGSLLAQELLGSTSLAGLPAAVSTAGAVLAAVAVGRISDARGRRIGLAAGYLAGSIGSGGAVLAAVTGAPELLFASLFVYGAGMVTSLQARYAGADLAAPGRRARAVSIVLVATTLGAVAGPNLATPTGDLAVSLGLPFLAGPFILAAIAYLAAALVLLVWLRPDPLLLSRILAEKEPVALDDGTRRSSDLLAGASVLVLTQLVMVAIMTMTPVHLHDHGHSPAAVGLVIAVHLAAMYLPSPVTGWLVDRYGGPVLATGAAVALLGAGLLGAVGNSVGDLAVTLGLVGLGWNLGLVSGTAIVTDAVAPAGRARTQGLVDVAIAISGAAGGTASGFVVALAGYSHLALGGGLLGLAVLPVVLVAPRAGGVSRARAGVLRARPGVLTRPAGPSRRSRRAGSGCRRRGRDPRRRRR